MKTFNHFMLCFILPCLFFGGIVFLHYQRMNDLPNKDMCEFTRPLKPVGGRIYNASWSGRQRYYLSYEGKRKASGEDCIVQDIQVTEAEYERRMYRRQ